MKGGKTQTGVGPGLKPRRRRWWRVGRYGLGGVGVLVALLVAARVALPWYLVRYLNRLLDRSPDYDGYVASVDVHLWRGAYTMHDVKINRISHAVPVPFYESPQVDVALDWKALAHGEARGRMLMDKPRLHFVQGPSPEETQTGADQPWLSIIHDTFPFRIDRAVVRDGEVWFHQYHANPQVHLHLTEVNGELANLTNVQQTTDPLIATVRASGLAMDSGKFEFDMALNPEERRPSFEMAVRILDLDATELNATAKAFGGFEFESGHFDLVVEVATKDGYVQGYVKPLFRNARLPVLYDLTHDPLKGAWETLVGTVGTVFSNLPRDQFGTRIGFEGDLHSPRMSILEVVGNVLRNAFVEAYLPRFEGQLAPDLTLRTTKGAEPLEGPLFERLNHEESNDRGSERSGDGDGGGMRDRRR